VARAWLPLDDVCLGIRSGQIDGDGGGEQVMCVRLTNDKRLIKDP
jgi:hypothetical protein